MSPDGLRASVAKCGGWRSRIFVKTSGRSPIASARSWSSCCRLSSPGSKNLREQVAYARAARWNCGCASFDVFVDREGVRRSSITASPAVEAYSKERDDPNTSFDLLLWVEDGWLAGVEIVDYVDQHGDDSPDEIPPPDYWHQPQPYKAPG
jgi:hypothetical protein